LNREVYHKYMFTIAAIWNWVLAVTFLILPRIDINNFYIAGDTIPPTLLWFDGFMGLVFAFGIGFYYVSRNIRENHGLIVAASFEKVYVFLIGLVYYLLSQASIWVVAVVTGDLVFGMLFIEDIHAIRKMV
jgi:hypothetical protein